MTKPHPRSQPRFAVVALVMLATLAAACGSSTNKASSTSTASPTTTIATAASETTAVATTVSASSAASASSAPVSSASGSGSTDTAASATPTTVATTSAPVACTGAPIKLTIVATLTGPLAFASYKQDSADAVKAATAAINTACTAGRPLAITVCDDQSDPNQSTECGRTAKSDGSLALIGSIGTQDPSKASGLPMLLTEGVGLTDLTAANAYPGTSAVTLVLGSLSAAAAAGVKEYLFVAADTPSAQLLVSQLKTLAGQLGITMDSLLFPADTTDFAPIAAQVSGRKPGAIGMAVPAVIPFLNALNDEGITPKSLPMFTAVSLIPPEVLDQLKAKADGMYLISQSVPAQDDTNAGIATLRAEYKAAEVTTDVAAIGTYGVGLWSKIHVIADAISKVPADQIGTLDSDGLVKALIALGPINRPELAPIDFSKPAFADNPVLATLRIFSRYAMAVQVKGGKYSTVSPFGDVTKPFEISS